MIQYKSLLPEASLKYKTGDIRKVKLNKSIETFELLKELFNLDTVEIQEEAIAIFLNRKNNTLCWIRVSIGGMAGTIIDIKLVAQYAILSGAHSVIISHNHPSGEVIPSEADKQITKKLKNGLAILEISLLDHIIFTENKYYSFLDEGEL